MTANEINPDEFRASLEKLGRNLAETADTSAAGAETVELDQSCVGRLSRMDAMQSQAMNAATEQRRKDMQQRVARALCKIESGDFGYCEACDEPVGLGRLAFDPTTTLCIGCAQKKETA